MPPAPDLLAAARSSYAKGDWPETYRALRAARDRGQLETDDLHALGDAAWWLGLIKETTAISEECHRRYLEEGRPQRAAMSALEVGFGWILRGNTAIGSGWLSRARHVLDDQPECAEQGFLLWLDASAALEAGDLDSALGIAQQVCELGRRFDSATLSSLALVTEGMVAIHQGQVQRGFALMDEAMLPVLAGRVPPDWAGNIYCQVMAVCHDLADFNRARQWTVATQQWCEGFPSAVMFLGICRLHRVQLLQLGGDWSRAESEATTACHELAEMNAGVVAEAHYQLAELSRLRGDLTAAEAAYRRAEELGRDPQPGLALLQLAQGHLDQAAAGVRAALAGSQVAPFRRARLLLAHAQIALAADDLDSAAASSAELSQTAQRFATPGFSAWARDVRGSVLTRRGRARDALEELGAALSRYEEMAAPYQAASVRLAMADAYEQLGESDAALAERTAAGAVFERLGAEPPPRSLGAPRPAQVRAAGLTAREAEVLARVAVGSSNRQIAAELSISEKTVARHLANIYLKLGVGSRTAASAWAYQHGVLPRRSRV